MKIIIIIFKPYFFYEKENSFCMRGGLFGWVHFPIGCAPFNTQWYRCQAKNHFLLMKIPVDPLNCYRCM